MNRRVVVSACMLAVSGFGVSGRAQVQQAGQVKTADPQINLDILSDTGGVNLNPYLHRLTSNLRAQWLTLLPTAGAQPTGARDEVVIRLEIKADGQIGAMRLESPLQGHEATERAAWSAVTQTSMQPPPSGIADARLGLRVHFISD